MMRWLPIALVAVAAGCGSDDFGSPEPDGSTGGDAQPNQDAIDRPDAGGQDAAPFCEIVFRFSQSDPGPDDITTYATVRGVVDDVPLTWSVFKERAGASAPFPFETIDRTTITFRPDEVTRYVVELSAPGCAPYQEVVTPDGVGTPAGTWSLQIAPPAVAGIPSHESIVRLTSDLDQELHVDIPTGVDIGVTLSWPGHPVPPSIVRFVPVPGTGRPALPPIEAFAQAGMARATLARRAHTMLVMPVASDDDTPAPQQITMTMPGSQQLSYFPGDPVRGTVLDSAGDAMAGAAISAVIAGVPTTLAQTGADGRFTLRTSTMGSGRLTVVPPRGSRYPRLEIAGVMGRDDDIEVRYAPGLRFRDLAGARIRLDQMSVRDASVTLVGPVAGAATASIDGVAASVAARFHATAAADGTGVLGGFVAPAVPLDAVLLAGGDRFAVVRVDLGAARPDILDIGPPVPLSGSVTASGVPRSGAQVRAVPTGPLAAVTAVAASMRTGTAGLFTLDAVPGATYDLAVTDVRGTFAEARRTGVTPGAIGAIALPPGKRILGSITVGGQTRSELRGGSVALVCPALDCPVEERGRPVAVAVIGADGTFRLVAPAPPMP